MEYSCRISHTTNTYFFLVSLLINQIMINSFLWTSAYPVNSEICSKRSGDSSSPSSCLFYTCSCRGGSASWLLSRCGTRPAPRDRWPRWSCSPDPPRTASSSGTWCCSCTPLDTARWPLRSPGGRAGRVSCCHPSRWTRSLGVTGGKSDRFVVTDVNSFVDVFLHTTPVN